MQEEEGIVFKREGDALKSSKNKNKFVPESLCVSLMIWTWTSFDSLWSPGKIILSRPLLCMANLILGENKKIISAFMWNTTPKTCMWCGVYLGSTGITVVYKILCRLLHSDHSIELNNQNRELREVRFFFLPDCENRVQVQHPSISQRNMNCFLWSSRNFQQLPHVAETKHIKLCHLHL